MIHPDDAARLGKMNIIASMQPIHATSDMLMADAFWGERSRLAYALKTQLDYGAPLALGSDAPVRSPNPFLGLYAAVTRRRADGSPSAEGCCGTKTDHGGSLGGLYLGPPMLPIWKTVSVACAQLPDHVLSCLKRTPLPASLRICLRCSHLLQWWEENGSWKT